jgi:ergothioneine biosynthesis protein EgtB
MSRHAAGRSAKAELLGQMQLARSRTDELFDIVRPEALYDRPIAERHRIIFYLGHLEAFEWNMACAGIFGMKPFNREFDHLFAFGIDPVDGNLPSDTPGDWPEEEEIRRYNRRVRDAVDECLRRASEHEVFWAAIEHRLMHAETLAYILHRLPQESKRLELRFVEADHSQLERRQVEIPSGLVTLGVNTESSGPFAWDNEFEAHQVMVPGFSIDRYKVTNAQFAEFVRAGGYSQRRFWGEHAWNWITSAGIRHPSFWKLQGSTWLSRSMFGEIPFQASWPVYVSHAEAEAYARWRGKSLPTEAQFHRAAFGAPDREERLYPWGNESPQPRHGNFDFARWDASPVDAHPAGDSAFGVAGLVGNGWEWTSTVFKPFPGFRPAAYYPGYSANFFDGKHYVLKGGSPRTASLLLRRSFRNWFQPFYPNIYASFRCVEN